MRVDEVEQLVKYDPKLKKCPDSIETDCGLLCVGDRVRYIGQYDGGVIGGKSGMLGRLVKIHCRWLSAREASRAGCSGQGNNYKVLVSVLWDDMVQSMRFNIREIEKAFRDNE